jgi:hypothetical protein
MNRFYVFAMAVLLSAVNSFPQEKPEEFKPYGKPLMKIYSNYHSISDHYSLKQKTCSLIPGINVPGNT